MLTEQFFNEVDEADYEATEEFLDLLEEGEEVVVFVGPNGTCPRYGHVLDTNAVTGRVLVEWYGTSYRRWWTNWFDVATVNLLSTFKQTTAFAVVH